MKMALFEQSQKQLALLGIEPGQSPFNGKNLKACLHYVVGVSATFAFLIFKAKSFSDYTNAAFISSSVTLIAICFTGLKLILFLTGLSNNLIVLNKSVIFTVATIQMANLFKFIDLARKVVDQSEWIHIMILLQIFFINHKRRKK